MAVSKEARAKAPRGASLLALVRVLSKCQSAPRQKIDALVRDLPIQQLSSCIGKDGQSVSIDPYGQELLVALACFLADSGGQHHDVILPVLVQYMRCLPYLTFTTSSKLSGFSAMNFCRCLVIIAAKIANKVEFLHAAVFDALRSLLDTCTSLVSPKAANVKQPVTSDPPLRKPSALKALLTFNTSSRAPTRDSTPIPSVIEEPPASAALRKQSMSVLLGCLAGLGESRLLRLSDIEALDLSEIVLRLYTDERVWTALHEVDKAALEDGSSSEAFAPWIQLADARPGSLITSYGTAEFVDGAATAVPPPSRLMGACTAVRSVLLTAMYQLTYTLDKVDSDASRILSGFFLAAIRALNILNLHTELTVSTAANTPLPSHLPTPTVSQSSFFSSQRPAAKAIFGAADTLDGPRRDPPGSYKPAPLAYVSLQVLLRCAVVSSSFLDRAAPILFEITNAVLGSGPLSLEVSRAFGDCTIGEMVELHASVVAALGDLGTRYPELSKDALEYLRTIVLHAAASQSKTWNNDQVRTNASNAICRILKACWRAQGETRNKALCGNTVLPNTVSSLAAPALEALSHDNPASRPVSTAVLTLLSNIATFVDHPQVTDLILPYLMEAYYTDTAAAVTPVILHALTDIALLGQEKGYREVMEFIEREYRSTFDQKSQTNTNTLVLMPNALQRLAKELKVGEQRSAFRKTILILFTSIAADIQGRVSLLRQFTQVTAMTGFLGLLLPPLADALDDFDIDNADEAQMKLFRTVWFHCVLFDMIGNKELMLPDWHNALCRIASHTPPLITRRSSKYLETEQVLLQILHKSYFSDQRLVVLRTQLGDFIGSTGVFGSSLPKFSIAQCTYLLSVYHLEHLRVLFTGTLQPIFSYLADQGIEHNFGIQETGKLMSECVSGIALTVMNDFMEFVDRMGATPQRQQHLEEQTSFLLTQMCSRMPRARSAAERFMELVVQRFPQILWSGRTWSTLLNLLEIVANSCEATLNPPAIHSLTELTEGYSGPSLALNLPEEVQDRRTIVASIESLSSRWLTFALTVAPQETQGLLQEYLQSFRSLSLGLLSHLGSSLAVQVAVRKRHHFHHHRSNGATRAAQPHHNPAAGGFITSLELKAYNVGEISGMKYMLTDLEQWGNTVPAHMPFAPLLCNHLVASFLSTVEQLHSGQQVDSTAFDSLMHRAAGFLIAQSSAEEDEKGDEGLNEKLLHLVAWVPVYIFTLPSLSTAVFVWRWICAAMPDGELRLLCEITEAWGWTIEHRLGLFSEHRRPQDYSISPDTQDASQDDVRSSVDLVPLPATATVTSPFPTALEQCWTYGAVYKIAAKNAADVAPHREWLSFFVERFEVIRFKDVRQVQQLVRWFLSTLASPTKFSTAPKSVGPRFKLLVLALKIVQSGIIADQFVLRLLRHRIYHTALAWFLEPPSYYDPGKYAVLEEDEKTLIDFELLVRSEPGNIKHYLPIYALAYPDVSVVDQIFGGPMLQRGGASAGGAGVHKPSNGRDSPPLQQPSTAQPPLFPEAGLLPADMSSFLESQRLLMLLLVRHDIDRLSAWRNPQNKPQLQLMKDTDRSTTDLTPAAWTEHLKTAWMASPRLALQLVLRFPTAPIRDQLQQLIRQNPAAVMNIPEALPFLVTVKNVTDDIPELRYLLYWAPVSLTMALALLGKEYRNHRLVTYYALEVMKTFDPAVVIFYLPQIVQALRHDRNGLISDFLLKMSMKSNKFAHQLIWTCQTESEVDQTKNDKSDPLPGIVTRLRSEILANFTAEAQKIYSEEFDFFNAVTQISGILKPLPPEARKGKIIEELKKLHVTKHLYLPTNVNSQVVSIVYDSASPMQSAAKVPILVAFNIRDGAALDRTASFASAGAAEDGDGAAKHPLDKRLGFTRKRSISIPAHGVRIPNPLPPIKTQACIFKVGDDCRQDCLALQFIRLFKNIFASCGLQDLYLFPYRVVTTAPGCGIIEVVPRAKSRDMLGKMSEGSLYEYFLQKYGHKNTIDFQRARRNFILSMAAYSVVSFILQIKDRHNGNILVDEDGHVVHIDFGFIFDISPGGDLRFERAPFKLSQEMIQIMGGGPDTEHFGYFMDLCVRAYLSCRQHVETFVTLAHLMEDSGLPGYGASPEMSLKNLRSRFCPELNERGAAEFMINKITESYDKLSTLIYDQFQAWANGIEY